MARGWERLGGGSGVFLLCWIEDRSNIMGTGPVADVVQLCLTEETSRMVGVRWAARVCKVREVPCGM